MPLMTRLAAGISAGLAELVDATDLKSVGHSDRAGSIPAPGTINEALDKWIAGGMTQKEVLEVAHTVTTDAATPFNKDNALQLIKATFEEIKKWPKPECDYFRVTNEAYEVLLKHVRKESQIESLGKFGGIPFKFIYGLPLVIIGDAADWYYQKRGWKGGTIE